LVGVGRLVGAVLVFAEAAQIVLDDVFAIDDELCDEAAAEDPCVEPVVWASAGKVRRTAAVAPRTAARLPGKKTVMRSP
jgi:hypothetical protein